MNSNYTSLYQTYDNFSMNLDLDKYSHLRTIKTVEQDLPKDLNPLEIYYDYYWFKYYFIDYDEIFAVYWSKKLNPHIYEFIKKYFYGCSLQFVEEGFKARLYRIWMSLLTQFHFLYLWNYLFDDKLYTNHEIDMMGIDAILKYEDKKLGLQIKKISYRREASSRRFTRRISKIVDSIIEIPYVVIDLDEYRRKIMSPRVKEENKAKYQALLDFFSSNLIKYDNGFVVFKSDYLFRIMDEIKELVLDLEPSTIIRYDRFINL